MEKIIVEFENIKLKREMFIKINYSCEIIDMTNNFISFLGYKKEDIIFKNINLFSLELLDIEFLIINKENTISLKNVNGEIVYLNYSVVNKFENIITLSLIDVTKYEKIKTRLDAFENIIENTKDILYSIQLKPECKYIYISKSIEKNLGYSVEENYSNPFLIYDITHPDFLDLQYSKSNKKTDFSKPIVTKIKSKITGEYIWQEDFITPFYDEDGDIYKLNGVCRSIQERKQLEEKLTYINQHDSLTGLYNRNYLEIKMKEYNEYKNTKLGIAFFDLDNLKEINDELGHKSGDSLIKESTQFIRSVIKDYTLFRFGGDEFIILFEDITLGEVEKELMKLNEEIEKYNLKTSEFRINISMGYAYTNNSLGKVEEVFIKADLNMYSNKKKRRFPL